MSKAPLSLERAKLVTHMAAVVFGTGEIHEQVLEVLNRKDPEGTFQTFSVADFLRYLSKTSLPDAWDSAVQIDQLLQAMARERLLMETLTGAIASPVFSRRYMLVEGITTRQAQGCLWMTPVLKVPLLMDALQGSLIHLTGRNPDGDVRGGTGLALSTQHILTARHVIDDMELDDTLVVPQPGGATTEVRVIDQRWHETHDLAIIIVDNSDAELAPVRGLVTRDPTWSDTINLFGYAPVPTSLSADPAVQTGEVVNPSVTTYDGSTVFLYSAVARPGDSGGPIFARDGRMIGMVTKELSRKDTEFTPAPFYAGLPARVIHACLADLALNGLLAAENWE